MRRDRVFVSSVCPAPRSSPQCLAVYFLKNLIGELGALAVNAVHVWCALYTSSGASRYGRKGRPRARQHRLRRVEHERQVVLRTDHTQQLAAAAQVGDAKGIRKKITEMKMRLIKDALKATGRG